MATATGSTRKVVAAIELANGGGVVEAVNGYMVESKRPGTFYHVTKAAQVHQWTCTCGRQGLCVHILAAYKVLDRNRMRAGAL